MYERSLMHLIKFELRVDFRKGQAGNLIPESYQFYEQHLHNSMKGICMVYHIVEWPDSELVWSWGHWNQNWFGVGFRGLGYSPAKGPGYVFFQFFIYSLNYNTLCQFFLSFS